MTHKHPVRLAAAAAIIVCAGVGGGTYAAVASPDHGSSSTSASTTWNDPDQIPPHGVNARGQTYGGMLNVTDDKDAPDLIAVMASNGRLGFALKSQLDAAPTTLAEVQNEPQDSRGFHTPAEDIPVYESDGVTVVGTFHIG